MQELGRKLKDESLRGKGSPYYVKEEMEVKKLMNSTLLVVFFVKEVNCANVNV